MISVVTWLWGDAYAPHHVNRLAAGVRRHYARPHRFLCLLDADDKRDGFDSGVEVMRKRSPFRDVPSPHGAAYPACYRRLLAFHPDAAGLFGERFICLDLDMVAVADLVPLWDRPEPFVGLRDPLYPQQLNGSMWLMTAGAEPHVWRDFEPETSPAKARAAGYRGSDQAWMSYALNSVPTWGQADGVLSYRKDVMPRGGRLPIGARIVSFHGRPKPDASGPQRLPWVREQWGVA